MKKNNSFGIKAKQSLVSFIQSGKFLGKNEKAHNLNLGGDPRVSCYGLVVKPELG